MHMRSMGFVFAACEHGQIFMLMTNKKLVFYIHVFQNRCVLKSTYKKMAFKKCVHEALQYKGICDNTK